MSIMQTKEIEQTIPFFVSTKRNLEMKIFAVREIKTERVAGRKIHERRNNSIFYFSLDETLENRLVPNQGNVIFILT